MSCRDDTLSAPPRTTRRALTRAARPGLSSERERVEVWAARLSQVGRGERAAELPDEVHLRVERRLREPRLPDEEDAAVEETARARETEHDRYPGVAGTVCRRDDADGDARRDEDAE